MATGNMHRKISKDRACGSRDMLADRQTDTQTYSSQYFVTTLVGEVKKVTQTWSRSHKSSSITPHAARKNYVFMACFAFTDKNQQTDKTVI